MDQMNYNHLRYFWAVAHDGNLTRTAERLNLSQSALSTQIKTLEERLGHALFERRGRALHLTEAGRIALDHADTIFATGAELLGTLNQTGAARKALRIGALATLSRNFQIGFLRPLLGREDVDVILRSGTASALMRGLESLNLDIILLNQAPPADALTKFVVNRLDEQPVSLVGAPERLENAQDLRDLLSRQPVLLPNRESSIRTGFDALTDRLGLQPQIAAEVDDMAMLRLLARENVGLALVPPIVVRDELASGLLAESPFDLGIAEAFFAVRLERRFPNPLLQDLLETL
ncbi:LysR family transcriptional regulator [Cognatishimia sp. MH4019]|uniref:LysR family transcriptional regulator n=1 Tax=Cognatishimia sp. MH4019 TaxID=2854030 RepID=UPI001CD500EB|nr:LysR family transcriptional regulator [Cognatishimia sp. MH4019]